VPLFHDNDGLVNLHEYALGGNPSSGFAGGAFGLVATASGSVVGEKPIRLIVG
jgi:hypothetical protein